MSEQIAINVTELEIAVRRAMNCPDSYKVCYGTCINEVGTVVAIQVAAVVSGAGIELTVVDFQSADRHIHVGPDNRP